ncbi:MAG: alanine--tRNA ligase [Chloroflexi bacterium]|nr:alanine--tRNA ligase [Chloroflexota bacterium]
MDRQAGPQWISRQVRSAFLRFFAERGHTIVASSSLIPGNDPTLLFVNAGMVQFKEAFLGLEKRSYSRAVTAQKCMRVSGKHNDLENVGPSPRHHTFFEMLGNFSLGDYFKREAVAYAFELMTGEFGIPAEKLVFTVHNTDDEAFEAWLAIPGVRPDQVLRMGDKTNFWMMADTGPCGPTSEIHYDWGKEACTCGQENCSVALDNGCERWLEIWNLVFMQFDQNAQGDRTPLPRPGVDTGMGLERIVAVLQNAKTNYDTDLFMPIMDYTQKLLGQTSEERERHLVNYRVIADHGRAMTFLIADGVLPGNTGRGYVLRLIMRRAMRYGRQMGFSGPFLGNVAAKVIEMMGDVYPELRERQKFILEVIGQEEERFARTLESGLAIFERQAAEALASGKRIISGEGAFRLYDTYGFPIDLTRDVARERGLEVDEAGFRQAMEQQRLRSQSEEQFAVNAQAEFYRYLDLPPTSFLGYESLESTSEILALVRENRLVETVQAGENVQIVLAATPFYAESGGQVGDTGKISYSEGTVEVTDTQRPVPGIIVHYGKVTSGYLRQGDVVIARVDTERRKDIMRNHTVTHLLHKSLRDILGPHAVQRGSLVAPDRLRFDFAHLQPVTSEELHRIEAETNDAILANLDVIPTILSLAQAQALGAMALFGEKYGDQVRMMSIGGDYSRELCGGTHLRHTGEIGFFTVVSEGSIGAGLRRIEALTGRWAEFYVRSQLDTLQEVAHVIGSSSNEILEKASQISQELADQRREIARLRRELSRSQLDRLIAQATPVDGMSVLAAEVQAMDAEDLRQMTDWIRDRLGSSVVVLGSVIEGKPLLVGAVTPDLIPRGLHAGNLIRDIARTIDGGGGGRPNLAQAGGKDASRLPAALAQVLDYVKNKV